MISSAVLLLKEVGLITEPILQGTGLTLADSEIFFQTCTAEHKVMKALI